MQDRKAVSLVLAFLVDCTDPLVVQFTGVRE